jgi:hypothetical protein
MQRHCACRYVNQVDLSPSENDGGLFRYRTRYQLVQAAVIRILAPRPHTTDTLLIRSSDPGSYDSYFGLAVCIPHIKHVCQHY